jgi:MFS family permease
MLAVLVTGQFMALLDATIVNVAMPTIGADLHASGSALQLIISGYAITYAMLLITAARLGNTFGTRWMFFGGLVTFTLASLACGLAPNAGFLIGARFVQGAGAAAMVPQIFSVIQREFTGSARARALSIYATVIAVGAVAGQIVGGVIVTADIAGAGWRPVFLLNVPIGVALAVLVPRLVPVGRVLGGRRLDLVGLVTASTAVLLIVLPLVLGREQGWPAWTWVSLVAGLALAVVFVRVERGIAARGGDPLLNLDVLRGGGAGRRHDHLRRVPVHARAAPAARVGRHRAAGRAHVRAGGGHVRHGRLLLAPAAGQRAPRGRPGRVVPQRGRLPRHRGQSARG